MAIPPPRPGLVISYSFLWHEEHRQGRDEGAKNRPCVIVLSAVRAADGRTTVRVVPITHRPPDDPALAVELPARVKQHLGLDDQRSWVMLDEMNVFAWPGFDLRPIGRNTDRFDYGFLPPRLFTDLVNRVRKIWSTGRGKPTMRD
jgi:mRNA-degrading endonuclease toxin of MazEF toxin-antitoxin module